LKIAYRPKPDLHVDGPNGLDWPTGGGPLWPIGTPRRTSASARPGSSSRSEAILAGATPWARSSAIAPRPTLGSIRRHDNLAGISIASPGRGGPGITYPTESQVHSGNHFRPPRAHPGATFQSSIRSGHSADIRVSRAAPAALAEDFAGCPPDDKQTRKR